MSQHGNIYIDDIVLVCRRRYMHVPTRKFILPCHSVGTLPDAVITFLIIQQFYQICFCNQLSKKCTKFSNWNASKTDIPLIVCAGLCKYDTYMVFKCVIGPDSISWLVTEYENDLSNNNTEQMPDALYYVRFTPDVTSCAVRKQRGSTYNVYQRAWH